MSKRIRVVVRGRVQNVGFRQFTASRAAGLGLSGWVRNPPEARTVELEAEGDDASLDALTAAMRRGPAGARVESVQVEVITPIGESGGFRIT
jgi:acylphosphatase